MIFRDYIKKILYLIGEDKKKLSWILLLFITLPVFEILGLGMIIPYVTLIIDPNSFKANFELFSAGFFKNKSDEDLLIIFGLVLFLIFGLKAIFIIIINKTIFNFSNLTGAKLRSKLLNSYQSMKYDEYLNQNSSHYMYSILDLAVKFSQSTLPASLSMVSQAVLAICILLFLAITDILILTIIGTLICSFVFFYDYILGEKITNYGAKTNTYQTKTLQTVNEAIEGFKEIKILNKEEYFHKKVSQMALKYANTYTNLLLFKTIPRFAIELILVASVVFIVFVAIFMKRDLVTIVPTLTVFCVSALRLMPAAYTFSDGLAQMRFGHEATNIIYKDLYNKKILGQKDIIKPVKYFKSLNLQNIFLSYGKKQILENVSLSINKGDSIGIIGVTGSGKTTLINIILGLIIPNKGSVFLNDKKVNNSVESLKGLCAYIPQNTFLIDDSIKKNIALGMREEEIDDKKLINAIEQAHLTDLVKSLPNGLNTNVGENGDKLSGGQRQRITLARAFYFYRQIFLLDEATSALDSETEEEINFAIRELKGKITTIIVAHRYSILKQCDHIYEIKNRELIYRGKYNDIVRT